MPSSGAPRGYGPEAVTSLQRDPDPARGRHATSYGQNYPRVVGWTLLGTLLPGAGLIAAGRRISGTIAIAIASLVFSAAVTFALVGDPVGLVGSMVSNPNRLIVLAVGLLTILLLWVAVVLGTHASLRRYAHLGTGQRLVSSLLVAALVTLVALPTAKAGSYALILRDTVTGIFGSGTGTTTAGGARPNKANGGDPWASLPRVNVLLIGSDAGADRIGIRPDTLILASINTRTGDTVLFSLPRNLQKVPFPPGSRQAADNVGGYFECQDAAGVPQCLLNAMWTFGEENWKQYYADQPSAYDAGLRATSDAVEQVTGLPVHQYSMLNLRGFMQFVDAIGGITVNVRQRLPIGGSSENHTATGGWIEAGPNQHLDGYHALWYARSRWSTDDFDRMRRQRCVIGAVIKEADPAKLALAFPQIAAAAKSNITTGIPLADLSAWVSLTQKVQKATVRSLPFTSSVINTADPDIAAVHRLVQEAINPTAEPTPSVEPSPAATPGNGKPTPSPSKSGPADTKQAQDINAVC
ncbi:MAG: LCP family protein [Kineosporiaceae bacterium]|nr:LCP family protein [Kineosporiaceae bacterium]MBK8075245.1 LCP family protein [Kineosporiaceae bacterium]